MTTVICWVKPAVGDAKKYKSKDGKNFQDKTGKSYTAPVESRREVMPLNTFFGRKYHAFYIEGSPNPIPVGHDTKWKPSANHDSDVDILVDVTKKALMESAQAKLERQLTMGGMGLVLVFMFFHHFW